MFLLPPYDVFGIFLPGAIILISLIVIYYSLFPPEIPIDLSHYRYMEWLIFFVSCYFSGFVAQAFARHLDTITAKIWSWSHAFTISDRGYDVEQSNKIFELARKKAAHVVGIDLESIASASARATY